MKHLITFLLGALTGACVLWFGFTKDLRELDKRLVMVDRFTGKASRVFVSIQESELATEKEHAQMEALKKKAAQEATQEPEPVSVKPVAAQPEWRDLNESEIKQLDFKWRVSGTSIYLEYHNPFQKDVRIDKVRVQIPAKEGHAAIDREYEVGMHSICPPLADFEDDLRSLNFSTNEFYGTVTEGSPQASGSDPFGTSDAPPSKASRRIVGTVTPARVLMRN